MNVFNRAESCEAFGNCIRIYIPAGAFRMAVLWSLHGFVLTTVQTL